jgi:hypothetical protein
MTSRNCTVHQVSPGSSYQSLLTTPSHTFTGLWLYVYEYKNPTGERIWAVWSPTGSNREAIVALPDTGGKVNRAERMPLKEGPAAQVKWETAADGKISLTVTESPAYLWIK